MRRWNGWGYEHKNYALPGEARNYLGDILGESRPWPEVDFDDLVRTVPPSRLPPHPLVDTDPACRLRHARGQSLPDRVALRRGTIGSWPDGVAFPADEDQVRDLLEFAARTGSRLIPYGGGTSLAGHINPPAGQQPVLTVSLERMNQLLELDEESRLATFGAGIRGPDLEAALRARGYTLGHFPQSFELSTLGGWVSTRSSGQQSLGYGRIENLFAGGRVETPAGTLELPAFPASATGPDLQQMVLGSEGRLGIITRVRVRVSPLPERESFYTIFFPDWETALQAVHNIMGQKLPLSMIRLSNGMETRVNFMLMGRPWQSALLDQLLRLRGHGPERCMMTIGLTGDRDSNRHVRGRLRTLLREYRAVWTGTLLGEGWQKNRFRLPYIRESLWNIGYAVDSIETAANWSHVREMVEELEGAVRGAFAVEGERALVFSHLSHLYAQGACIYTTCVFRGEGHYEKTLARWQHMRQAGIAAVQAHAGTLSHHHGIGLEHKPWLEQEKSPLGIRVIRGMMEQFDPDRMMNPGKLV